MKFYVAGKYQERDKIRIIYNELERLGHTITVDWTNHDIDTEDAIDEKKVGFAQDDIEGVRDCDIFLAILLNDHAYKGLWVEMGAALALGKPVNVIGEAGNSCIFIKHPLVKQFKNLPEFYTHLA